MSSPALKQDVRLWWLCCDEAEIQRKLAIFLTQHSQDRFQSYSILIKVRNRLELRKILE
jgi:hypothetical protein